MAINDKFMSKYNEAYTGLTQIISPIEFEPWSEHYHEENWRDVLPCYVPGVIPNMYKVSTHGRVYSNMKSPLHPNGGIIRDSLNQRGYHQINLRSVDKKKICVKIARLVMLHFRFTPGCQRLEVDHIDGNKDNNCIWNLDWVYPEENTRRAVVNGQRHGFARPQYQNIEDPTEEVATELFLEAVKGGQTSYAQLCNKYLVEPIYIRDLVEGLVYPNIRIMYNQGLIK